MRAEPAAVPLPNLACPLCGDPNRCAAAQTGSFATACWCAGAAIDPAALARIPEHARGQVCLCPRCAGVPA
ncbi:MAG: cysteine-rich CWC family protein [Burkholderiales bacterium]|nr:cysteine-rich CWC family protein [Burkholderiales bacterium]